MKGPHHQAKVIKLPLVGDMPLSPAAFIQDLKSKEGPLWAQIFKFGICGLITTGLFMLGYLLAELWAPEYISESLETGVRQRHLMLVMIYSFIPANLIAFWLNRTLVFHSRKHKFWLELTIFLGLATLAFLGGEFGKRLMVEAGYTNLSAVVTFAVGAAGVNFLARKIFVFGK